MTRKPDLRAILQMLGIDPDQYQRAVDNQPIPPGSGIPPISTSSANRTTPGLIEWDTRISPKQKRTSNRVEWGTASALLDTGAAALVGMEDAFEHTPLLPGEKVAYCTLDRVAYHLTTWSFLRRENEGRCCICGRSNIIRLILLPAAGARPAGPLPDTTGVVAVPQLDKSGLQVISLKDVHNHLNLAVVVEDYVHEVYQTRATGTYFIRFQPRENRTPPFDGFKVVVFRKYFPAWELLKITPKIYQGNTIRVRGLIQRHPDWGIEILVNSPRVIEIVKTAETGQEEKSE